MRRIRCWPDISHLPYEHKHYSLPSLSLREAVPESCRQFVFSLQVWSLLSVKVAAAEWKPVFFVFWSCSFEHSRIFIMFEKSKFQRRKSSISTDIRLQNGVSLHPSFPGWGQEASAVMNRPSGSRRGGRPCSLCWPRVHSAVLNLQHTLTIQRQTGGLGISIAGGKGSTPYKGDDEVRPRSGPVRDIRGNYII